VEGASGKEPTKAQPKILNDSPPKEDSELPEDVRRHNEEMDRRAEKAREKVSNQDIEK
jgi:hypothetical protein